MYLQNFLAYPLVLLCTMNYASSAAIDGPNLLPVPSVESVTLEMVEPEMSTSDVIRNDREVIPTTELPTTTELPNFEENLNNSSSQELATETFTLSNNTTPMPNGSEEPNKKNATTEVTPYVYNKVNPSFNFDEPQMIAFPYNLNMAPGSPNYGVIAQLYSTSTGIGWPDDYSMPMQSFYPFQSFDNGVYGDYQAYAGSGVPDESSLWEGWNQNYMYQAVPYQAYDSNNGYTY